MKRLLYKDGTFRPQYWLFGWRSFKDTSGREVEFMNATDATALSTKHDPYRCLKTLVASTFLSTCFGFALLFLTVYLW